MNQYRSFLLLACSLLLGSLTPRSAPAAETLLLFEQFADCQIRVSAFQDTKTDTATLRFDAFTLDEAGIQQHCSPGETTVADSLEKAFATHKQQASPPRLTSLFIGRLDKYNWIRDYLATAAFATHSPDTPDNKIVEDFVTGLMASTLLDPFRSPADQAGYPLPRLSCEKLITDSAGRPLDALCWLVFAGGE
ncbi:hypothetical protein [Kiloniella laminariae]|uniref:hypothetical protein n=1 Tax=Kiloniella laminariae TaxID=454162 RepID=UPI0003AA3E5C|nr:hypothetical protein [Kiloniella laminariae]